MPNSLFEELKQSVQFGGDDARHLTELRGHLSPYFVAIVSEFYDRLLDDPRAQSVFSGGKAQHERLRHTLHGWLVDVFTGPYDEAYFERRAAIGRTHVRVQLPQYYMLTGMNTIRLALLMRIAALGLPDEPAKCAAVNRVLDLDLAIMLETYRDDLIARLREVEKDRYEQRLNESRHLATVGQLAASLAHEIKNPLAGISGALQILDEGLAREHPHKEVLKEGLAQIARLDAAVKDLLIFARPKAPVRRRQSMKLLLQRAMLLLREEPTIRNLIVRTVMPSEEIEAEVDEAQMQQVLSNLIINAAHACGPEGQVVCRLDDDDSRVRLLVEDNGRGMATDVVKRAFEPFFTTKAKGTGLGLAICRRIVLAHGGDIQIHSQHGVGTRVTVTLPKAV